MLNRKVVSFSLAAGLLLAGCGAGEDERPAERAEPVPVVTPTASSEPAETETSAEPAETETSAESAETETSAESAETDNDRQSETSPRGNLIKELGEIAGVTEDGNTLIEFSVTSIETNFQCTSEYAEPPENGNFIAVSLDIQTTPEAANSDVPSWELSPTDLKVIGPDGTRENESATMAAYSCLDESDALPMNIGPAEHVVGKIVIDSQYTSGAIVIEPWWLWGDGAWEWTF